MNNRVCTMAVALTFGAIGRVGFAAENERINPSTCYLSVSEGIGLMTCANERSELSPLQAVSVETENTDSTEPQIADLKLSISGASNLEESFGTYILALDAADQLQVTVRPFEEGSGDTMATPIAYRRGGGAAVRRGGYGYRGGGVAYRRGGVYRRGAVVGGAIVGGAVGAAASGYCDPNYSDCSGYYGSGYVPGAVIGGAAAAGAYRRGGVVYRRGGAAWHGGGGRVYHGGGRRRR